MCKTNFNQIQKIYPNSEIIIFTSKPFKSTKLKQVQREIEVDNGKQPKFKYQEILKWDNKKSYKTAICIGFNPAKAEQKIDTTNNRIIKLLNDNDYDQYILFNLYPEITDNKNQVNFEDNKNQEFFELLKNYISTNYPKTDIVLFFGRTTVIKDDLKSWLERLLQQQDNIFITIHKNLFTHPGSNGDIELKKLTKERFQSSTTIK